MKKVLAGLMVTILLAGCATPTPPTWVATESKDQFTDKITRTVTYGDANSGQYLITRTLRYYPFVGIHNGELFLGVRSGGPTAIPTGTVQIRIDNNAAWTINPEETPLHLVPGAASAPDIAGLDKKTNELIANAQKMTIDSISKAMSPYTAATGEKAQKILNEMLSGKTLIYRTVGMNQASSTTGEATIDASFRDGLQRIGISTTPK